jgi:Apea-like HEPN
MAYQNESLHAATEVYVRAALDSIAKKTRTQMTSSEPNENDFFFTRLKSADGLAKLPEYRPCLEAITCDQHIARQLDVMAGTGSKRSRAPSAEQLMSRILDLGINGGRYEFDAEHFGREYAAFEEAYYSSDILYEVIAPLQGLLIGSPVRLSDDLEISHLKEGELNWDRRPRGGTDHEDSPRVKPCAVRTSCPLSKVMGDDVRIGLEAMREDDVRQAEANDRVEQVVGALRLYGIDSVFPAAIVHRASRWSFGHDRPFPGRFQPDIDFSTRADDAWLSSFKQFWDRLQSQHVRKRKFLDIAMRRYSYAHERHRLEDKIVDLLIAAEALFLSDQKEDPYKGEIRYRLSLRAAAFLAPEGESRRRIFRQMRAAYDLRSAVVHGTEAEKVKLPRQPDGGPTQLKDFVWAIQELIRVALHKAIGLALLPESPTALVTWDELIFNVDRD